MAESLITINITEQRLRLEQGAETLMDVAIATASNGPGELNGSECTPRGRHTIRSKLGAGCATNTVFIGRRTSGHWSSEQLRAEHPQTDWTPPRPPRP